MEILATQHPGQRIATWMDQALTEDPGSVNLHPTTREETAVIPFDFDYPVQCMCFYGRADLNHPSKLSCKLDSH